MVEVEIETEIDNQENKQLCDKVIDKIEESIETIITNENIIDNLNILEKLVNIHKDMYNEKYWKAKENNMMYNNYGRRYEPYGNDYNRRGVDEKYRGNDYIDGMYNGYNRYEEGRRDYNRGNYNAKDDTLNSLRYMLESAMQFINMLKSEANSQEEMQMIREYTKRISEM